MSGLQVLQLLYLQLGSSGYLAHIAESYHTDGHIGFEKTKAYKDDSRKQEIANPTSHMTAQSIEKERHYFLNNRENILQITTVYKTRVYFHVQGDVT